MQIIFRPSQYFILKKTQQILIKNKIITVLSGKLQFF